MRRGNKYINISPEEEKIYKEIAKNLKKIYRLKKKDREDEKNFNKEYGNMFTYEDELYNDLNNFAENIAKYGDNYYKELDKKLNNYEKSFKGAASILRKIINRRKRIKKYFENTKKLIEELEKMKGTVV